MSKPEELDIVLDANTFEALAIIERSIWEKAIRSVKCILPDDAEDVETAAQEIRREITRRISHSSTRHQGGDLLTVIGQTWTQSKPVKISDELYKILLGGY